MDPFKGEKRASGQITVFLSLTLFTLLSIILVFLESARTESMRAAAMMEAQLAMNALFSEYDPDLYKRYDIFFIDGSVGGTAFSEEKVNGEILAFLGTQSSLKPFGVTCTGRIMAAQQSGAPFYEQAVSYMEGRSIIGLLSADALSEGKNLFSNVPDELSIAGEISDQIEQSKQAALENAREEYEQQKAAAAAVGKPFRGSLDLRAASLKNPISTLRELLSTDVLDLAGDGRSISECGVPNETLLSSRECAGGFADLGVEFAQNTAKDYLFISYVKEKLPSLIEEKECPEGVLSYQCEYVAAGKDSDRENLRAVLNRLLLVRFALNMSTIAASTGIASRAGSMALAMTSAVGLPALADVVKTALELLLAYEESLIDIHTLCKGGNVPLVKREDQIECPVEGVFSFSAEAVRASGEGLDYSGYLQILMFAVDRGQRTLRCMDMVEHTLRAVKNRSDYRLSDGIGGWRCRIDYEGSRFFYRKDPENAHYIPSATFTYYP